MLQVSQMDHDACVPPRRFRDKDIPVHARSTVFPSHGNVSLLLILTFTLVVACIRFAQATLRPSTSVRSIFNSLDPEWSAQQSVGNAIFLIRVCPRWFNGTLRKLYLCVTRS
jgi:hypothetical protein